MFCSNIALCKGLDSDRSSDVGTLASLCAMQTRSYMKSMQRNLTSSAAHIPLCKVDSLIRPTLSYFPESCQATLTQMGLQWRPLMSSRTSSLASLMASFFVVLLAV